MDGTNVCVSWRDEFGIYGVEINAWGIGFLDGYAFFNDLDEKGYKIPVNALIEVAFI